MNEINRIFILLKYFNVKLVNINNKNDITFVNIYAKNAIHAAYLINKWFPEYIAVSSDIIQI